MNDKAFLKWLHNRLHTVHGENLGFDYMSKLRSIIANTPEDKLTPNCDDPEFKQQGYYL